MDGTKAETDLTFDLIIQEMFDDQVVAVDFITGKYYTVTYTVDDGGVARARDVHHHMVLQVGTRPHTNDVYVPAQDRLEPDRGPLTDLHITDDACPWRHKHIGCKPRM